MMTYFVLTLMFPLSSTNLEFDSTTRIPKFAFFISYCIWFLYLIACISSYMSSQIKSLSGSLRVRTQYKKKIYIYMLYKNIIYNSLSSTF